MKHLKMVLYGEPGVGKSVFASKAPKPFFITTDGNYEFLEEFGAKEKDHIQVHSWSEAKKVFTRNFDEYETIVIDLTEDLFKWCEYEYCKLNGLEHVSDVGFAKGYDSTRNDYFINICKVIDLPKNVILIMHGLTYTTKDRRGIEYTKYGPTNRLPDKVLDLIEGRVRFFLRCYQKAEEIDGKLIKKRYLSLIPKENEYGILRGIDENKIPSDIPLDFDTFAKLVNLEISTNNVVKETKVEQKVEQKVVDIKKPEVVETSKNVEEDISDQLEATSVSNVPEVSLPEKDNVAETIPEPKKEETREEKLARIRAKMAALQNK